MRKFKYIFIVFLYLFSVNTLHAKEDVYLATGVLTGKKDTDIARAQLEIDLKKSNPEIYGSEPFKSVYNTTHGFWDFIESAAQLLGQNGWTKYWNGFISATNQVLTQHYIDYFSGVSKNHDNDLTEQKTAYNTSLNAGNQVIVIAHSQGNYFTNEVYNALSECQKQSFYMLGTANPASKVSGMKEGRGALATLDNDPITFVPYSMSPNIINSDTFVIEGYSLKLMKYHEFAYYRTSNSVTKSKIETFPEYAINHYNQNNKDKLSQEYPVDIQLSWDNPNINLKLMSELGVQEFSSACTPQNRYYVESEDDLSVGIYKVFINHNGVVEDEALPLNMRLAITTPRNAYEMKLKIFTADLLNLGHVVDINISTDDSNNSDEISFDVNTNSDVNRTGLQLIVQKYRLVYGGSGGTGTTQDSTGGGDGSGGSRRDTGCYVSDTLTYEEGLELCFGKDKNSDGGIQTNENNESKKEDNSLVFDVKSTMNVTEMGPIGGANFSLIDTLNGNTLYESSTTLGSSLGSTGIMLLPREILNTLVDDRYYMIQIMSGVDIDRDDNGVFDEVPTEKKGDLHGLYSGKTLKTSYIKVNILTEVVYQVTKEMLNTETNSSIIESHLNYVAKRLFLPSSKEGDYIALTKWMPRFDKKLLRKKYTQNYEPIAQKIYAGEEIYNDAYKIVYEPSLLTYSLSYIENSPLSNFSQKIDVGLDNQDVVYNLTGKGSELFYIDESGVIYLKNDAVLDYEVQRQYTLHLSATANGFTANSTFYFTIKNVLDNPELENLIVSVEENSPSGTVVGTIIYKEGTSEVSSFKIFGEGSENFVIDVNGVISVAPLALLNYEAINRFSFQAIAVNASGSSLASLVDISLLDLADTPILSDFTINIDENITTGSIVGYIPILSDGGSDISKFVLSGIGDYIFNVSLAGLITVKDSSEIDFESRTVYNLKARATNANDKGLEVDVVININNLIDAPTFYNTSFSVNEHTTHIGKILISENQDCSIKKINVDGYLSEHFIFGIDGMIQLAPNVIIDYETNSHYRFDIEAETECGFSNKVELNISVNDLDENTQAGIGILYSSRVNIYVIENNTTLTKVYRSGTDKNGMFNNHKYELDLERYYLYEVVGGIELDIDYDGDLVYWRDGVNFKGKLRAIAKGEWVNDIPRIKVSPVSELIVDYIENQVDTFDISSLENRMLEATQQILKIDIDGSGEIDIYDSLLYNAKDIYDPYIVLSDFNAFLDLNGDLTGEIGQVQIITIQGGSVSSLELIGTDSELFVIDSNGVLSIKESLPNTQHNYVFRLKAMDINANQSSSNISIMVNRYSDEG